MSFFFFSLLLFPFRFVSFLLLIPCEYLKKLLNYEYVYTTLARSWSGSIPVPMRRRLLTVPMIRLPWSRSWFSMIPRSRSCPSLAPRNVRLRAFSFLRTRSGSVSSPGSWFWSLLIPGTGFTASRRIGPTSSSTSRMRTWFPFSPGTWSRPFPGGRAGSRSTTASRARSTPFTISRSRSVFLAGPIIARRPWTIFFTRLYRSRPGLAFVATLGRTRSRLSASRFTSTFWFPFSVFTITNFARSFLLQRVTTRVRARRLWTARFGIGWPWWSIGLCHIRRHYLLLWTLSAARQSFRRFSLIIYRFFFIN